MLNVVTFSVTRLIGHANLRTFSLTVERYLAAKAVASQGPAISLEHRR